MKKNGKEEEEKEEEAEDDWGLGSQHWGTKFLSSATTFFEVKFVVVHSFEAEVGPRKERRRRRHFSVYIM